MLCGVLMNHSFFLLSLFSWLAVGSIAVMWMYSFDDEAYEFGKIAVAFMVGATVGMAAI